MKFSLREMLFAVVAVGALMGWLVERPYLVSKQHKREAVLIEEIQRLKQFNSSGGNVFIGYKAGGYLTPSTVDRIIVGHQTGTPVDED